ncbi:MAG TPA: thiamine pyrophosphate-dependent enzyme [Vicinamibacterales bacterium]|nr:thiamine pyrophosphate-dependent enzyme [Vicinamibacterales bacterium]
MTNIHAAARPGALQRLFEEQSARNRQLLKQTPTLGDRVRSEVLPFTVNLQSSALSEDSELALAALEKTAATIAIESLISLAKVNDIDHLGGGLELIGPLLMTLGVVDYQGKQFTIEHGHTSIGYYSALAALGFLPRERVIDQFRRSLDIAGHVLWVPGGTPVGSGRLGITVPVTAGWSLALKAAHGEDAFVICHCGDAGWISGQALNGFFATSRHDAPVTFVMHRNGIQLSGTTEQITGRDPRPIVTALGVEVIEIASLHDRKELFKAYAHAYSLARSGKPSLIYPVGFDKVTVRDFAKRYAISQEAEHFCAKNKVAIDTPVKVPGSLMSYRDPHAMLECLFYVNELPGGEGHHDGGMKGRDHAAVLANPMLQASDAEKASLDRLRTQPKRIVEQTARAKPGSPNLVLTSADVAGVVLPGTDKPVSARAGSEAAYVAVAKKYAASMFFVSCDLNPSTKLGKAAAMLPPGHTFEMSIQEQAAALMTDGLSLVTKRPQLNVFATFAAFMEGIAREGFEFWRYQRNLDGVNEGFNVLMHFSHVGANTGRDHFSGWSLDWVNLALGYLPLMHRFYAPADARAAFLAVRDAAAHFGGHIVAIPRDTLPILTKQGGSDPLWEADDAWTPVTQMRSQPHAKTAILGLGAPTYLAAAASEKATASGVPTDVYVVNGFPLAEDFLSGIAARYERVITIEDGLIGTPSSGLQGFAALAASTLAGAGVSLQHFGIVDPAVAPSEEFGKVWEHFGMTEAHLLKALLQKD